jgi:hypothetical protein
MKTRKILLFICFLVGCALMLTSCGQKAEEPKPQPKEKAAVEQRMPEQKAEVQEPKPVEEPQIDLLKIKEAALKEKEIILAKKDELQKLIEEKAKIPMTDQLGTEAKELTQKITDLENEIQEHTERYQGYAEQLKAGNVDTSEIEM